MQYDSPASSTQLNSALTSNTNISSATQEAISNILNLSGSSSVVVAGGTVTPQGGTVQLNNAPSGTQAVLLNINAQAGDKVNVVIPTDVLKVGGNKNTVLDGGAGNDTLITSGGNDSISGGLGNDTIISGNGNDTIDGGAGNDWLIGGNGKDTYVLGNLSTGQADTIVDFGKNALTFNDAQLASLKLGGKTLDQQTKNLKVGTKLDTDNSIAIEGNKLLVDLDGDSIADYIAEFAGSSKLALKFNAKDDSFAVNATANKAGIVGTATAGADTLIGTKKADVLTGGAGNDVLVGGAGKDLYQWSNADLNAGGFDVVVDDKGSKLDLGNALAALGLKIDGSVLADLSKGKVTLGSEINATNSVAFKNGALQIDLNGDGVFDNTNDFKIEIVGTVKGVVFNAKSDTFDLI